MRMRASGFVGSFSGAAVGPPFAAGGGSKFAAPAGH